MSNPGRCPFHHSTPDIQEFDMLDPKARQCPHRYYQWLQQDLKRRVYPAPHEKSFYVVHTYDDVKQVLTNTKQFSSEILPTHQSPFLALMDGENHLRQREVANTIFQVDHEDFPKQAIHEFIESTTESLIKKNESADVIDLWAMPIPLASLCIIFGIEPSEKNIGSLHHRAIIINKALFVLGGTGLRRKPEPDWFEKISIAFSLLKNYSRIRRLKRSFDKQGWKTFKQMFIPRKSTLEFPRPDFSQVPGAIDALLELMIQFDDVLSDVSNQSRGVRILRENIQKGIISQVEAVMLCTFILFAGYETSLSLLSNSIYHLAKHPELLNSVKNEDSQIDNFIEEVLRYYTPVGRFLRRAKEDVKFGEQVIPKGSMVIALLGGANLDPERFDNPMEFDHTRDKNQHMSFGKGIHFCIGASLARFQAKTALLHLIQSTKALTIDDSKPLEIVTNRDNGILRLEKLWINVGS